MYIIQDESFQVLQVEGLFLLYIYIYIVSSLIKDMCDIFKCFSLFGLIHILLDTRKPLSAVVVPLMFPYVPLSR